MGLCISRAAAQKQVTWDDSARQLSFEPYVLRLNGCTHCGACCNTTRARCFSKLISFVIRQEMTTYPAVRPIGQNKEIQYFNLD